MVLLTAVACAVNPVTGNRELMLLSEAQEIQLGRENDTLVVAEYGLYDEPELAEWMERTARLMAAASERPQLPWEFRVLDDTIVNAFALPGGYIYMTRGILAYMNSEAEVVGVLGHEIGHVTARHGAQRYTSASLGRRSAWESAVFCHQRYAPWAAFFRRALGCCFSSSVATMSCRRIS